MPDLAAGLLPVGSLSSRPLAGRRAGLVVQTLGEGVSPAVEAAVRAAAAHLQALGAEVEEVSGGGREGRARQPRKRAAVAAMHVCVSVAMHARHACMRHETDVQGASPRWLCLFPHAVQMMNHTFCPIAVVAAATSAACNDAISCSDGPAQHMHARTHAMKKAR